MKLGDIVCHDLIRWRMKFDNNCINFDRVAVIFAVAIKKRAGTGYTLMQRLLVPVAENRDLAADPTTCRPHLLILVATMSQVR